MKTAGYFLVIVMLLSGSIVSKAQEVVSTKLKLKLAIPGSRGNNGAGIAYNPKKKLYYAAFAGNTTYPLVVFNKSGKVVNDKLETSFDVRGFWFNEKTNEIQGTPYGGYESSAGYYSRSVNGKGIPTGEAEYRKLPKMYQPDDQACGAYNPKTEEILFRKGGTIYKYSQKTGLSSGTLDLKMDVSSWDNISSYTLIYTGKKGEELGIFDFENSKIYLFDEENGKHTKTVLLPEEAPDPDMMNFSYANGMFWLYSVGGRIWYGYEHS